MKLTTELLDKLAGLLGVRARDLLPDAGAFFAAPDRNYSGRRLPALKMPPRPPVWLAIEGSGYEPFLHAGDAVQLVPIITVVIFV